jgi:hypothetical protein
MTTSDWITIGSVLISMSFTIAVILFRMGVILGGIRIELKILSDAVARIETRLDLVVTTVTKHKGRIKRLERDAAKHRRSHQ